MDKKNRFSQHRHVLITIGLIVVVVGAMLASFMHAQNASTVRYVRYSPNIHAVDDNLLPLNADQPLEVGWKAQSAAAYRGLRSFDGGTIALERNGVSRLDPDNGHVVWSHHRLDSTLCDATTLKDWVIVLYDSGNGCSDLMSLRGRTGEYGAQARYATHSHEAKLVAGHDHIAIVTPNFVRLVREDLVNSSTLGDNPAPINPIDLDTHDCTVSDVVIGSDKNRWAVAAQCNDNATYHVYVQSTSKENDDDEDTNAFEIDSGSPNPVTLGPMTSSQIMFATQHTRPTVYAWQLDKERAEVSSTPLNAGSTASGYQDFPGIGYVWTIGDELHLRYGSEDVSTSDILPQHVRHTAFEAGNTLVVPGIDEVVLWERSGRDGNVHTVDASHIPPGIDYAYSGKTLYVLQNDGSVIGVKSVSPPES